MKTSIIVAIADNNVIGNNNSLIWHIPEDLKYFKNLTMGHPIIMGRKTFESIGKPLPGRTNVILTRNKFFKVEGCLAIHSIEQLYERFKNEEEIFIIGGAEIYNLFIAKADQLYITRVCKSFQGDVFFPKFNLEQWHLEHESERLFSQKQELDYQFQKYVRT